MNYLLSCLAIFSTISILNCAELTKLVKKNVEPTVSNKLKEELQSNLLNAQDAKDENINIEQLIKDANNGNAIAKFKLGDCFNYGIKVKEDKAKAVFWYKKAALKGNTKAMMKYGSALINGIGTKKDEVEGFSWLKKAANTNDAKAMALYGCKLILTDKLELKNPQEGISYLKKAVAKKEPIALTNSICRYVNGWYCSKTRSS